MPGQPYSFHRLRPSDLALIGIWLHEPEVRQWWGEPHEQYALIEGDLHEAAMRLWLVAHAGTPFAYIQDYDPRGFPTQVTDGLPAGARGIDQFIGVPEMLGRGHGSAFIRAHADRLLAEGTPCAFTDPDPENLRARRAYAKAGFVEAGLRQAEDGPALLMIRWPTATPPAPPASPPGPG